MSSYGVLRSCKFSLTEPFIVYDPDAHPSLAAELGIELVGLDHVFRQADFVSVNCPLNDAIHHQVNADRLALMKPTA